MGLLGQGAAGRDHVGSVLEGLQVLCGVDRDHGGDRCSIAGEKTTSPPAASRTASAGTVWSAGSS
jgi:hypothetical protein